MRERYRGHRPDQAPSRRDGARCRRCSRGQRTRSPGARDRARWTPWRRLRSQGWGRQWV